MPERSEGTDTPVFEMDEMRPLFKEFFIGWLIDPRPDEPTELIDNENFGGVRLWIDEDSPTKGTLKQVAEALGVSRETLRLWRKDPKFQAAYRKAVADEMSDPTHMLSVMRKLRQIATGEEEARPADVTKAAEAYARLTGYVAPEVDEEAELANLSTEELEKLVHS